MHHEKRAIISWAVIVSACAFVGVVVWWIFFATETVQEVTVERDVALVHQEHAQSDTSRSVVLQRDVVPAEEVAPVQLAFAWPMDRAVERITKKPFGILIDPASSPVQPERFSGYHTGTDFEVFPDEIQQRVYVRAVCTGALRVKQNVNGYGGVIVQECRYGDESITVLYGHLAVHYTPHRVGDVVAVGEVFAQLGEDGSRETDGERKHLHVGVHRTSAIVFAGYVARTAQLSPWMDLAQLIGI